jgi:hypothetical protein
MRRSFILAATLVSIAGLVLAVPAVLAQAGSTGQSSSYQGTAGSQSGYTGNQYTQYGNPYGYWSDQYNYTGPYGPNQYGYGGSQYPTSGYRQGRVYGSQYGQRTGPYAQDLGYGKFGSYGSPYIPEVNYPQGGTYGSQTGGYGGTQYGQTGYAQQYGYQGQPSQGWSGWRHPMQGYQGYADQQGYFPTYRSSGYYSQPGWTGPRAWRSRSQQPYGYTGYGQQGYFNRGGYYQGSSCPQCYEQRGMNQGWYGWPTSYDWSSCGRRPCQQSYGTVGYPECGDYGQPCPSPINRYNGAIPHESWEM